MPNELDGVPDGAQCDADGCLWIALSGASKCVRVNRDGVVDHEIELPVKSPTSITFGGGGLDTIFVTTAAGRTAAGSTRCARRTACAACARWPSRTRRR